MLPVPGSKYAKTLPVKAILMQKNIYIFFILKLKLNQDYTIITIVFKVNNEYIMVCLIHFSQPYYVRK